MYSADQGRARDGRPRLDVGCQTQRVPAPRPLPATAQAVIAAQLAASAFHHALDAEGERRTDRLIGANTARLVHRHGQRLAAQLRGVPSAAAAVAAWDAAVTPPPTATEDPAGWEYGRRLAPFGLALLNETTRLEADR